MKTKTKFEIIVVGIIIVAIGYIFFSSKPQQVEAQRTIVIDGDLYKASNLYRSEAITNTKDVRMLFEERANKMLVGKGLEGYIPNTEEIGGTTLYLYTPDGETKVSEKSNVNYAIFDKNGENIFYFDLEKLEIYQYNIQEKKLEKIIKDALPPRLSPDGKSLAYDKLSYELLEDEYNPKRSLGVAIYDIESKKERVIAKNTAGGLQWTLDGQHFVFTGSDGFYMVNSDGKNLTKLGDFQDGTNAYGVGGEFVWSSDGRYYVRSFNEEIIVIELDIPNRKILTAGAIGYGSTPKWVEEGKTISVLSPDAKVGAPALSVIDLNGKVLSGDKSHEKEYYSPSKGAFRRVAPKPVPPPLPPEPPREIPPGIFHSINTTQSSDVPKKIPTDALKPITQ